MDPLTMALIGMGTGAFKSLNDKIKQDQEKKVHENLVRLSPWTHTKISDLANPRDVDVMGNIAGGGVSGLQQGMALNKGAPQAQPAQIASMEAAPGEMAPQVPSRPTWDRMGDFNYGYNSGRA